MTGLQKCFLKKKGLWLHFQKKEQFYLGIEKAELGVSVLYSLTDVRDQDCREHTWVSQKKVIGVWRVSP